MPPVFGAPDNSAVETPIRDCKVGIKGMTKRKQSPYSQLVVRKNYELPFLDV
jgi:hypothetical protein